MQMINNRKRPFPFRPAGSEGNGRYDYTIIESGEPIAAGRAARRLLAKVEKQRAISAGSGTPQKKKRKKHR